MTGQIALLTIGAGFTIGGLLPLALLLRLVRRSRLRLAAAHEQRAA